MGNSGYKVHPDLLFWIRLKTLTFTNEISRILEIAYIYTDLKLTACQLGAHIVLSCPQEQFLNLDHHQLSLLKANGLYDACTQSTVQVQQAEDLIMKDIEFRNIARGQLLAAGKQAHLVKYALMRHMPKLHDFLHYRIFDLSSVQFVVERFRGTQNFSNLETSKRDQKEKNQIEKENEETSVMQKDEILETEKLAKESQKSANLSELLMGEKRADEEVWQDIHQMQFYCQHALNDE